ncbi:MAG: TetR/AcrR family transcriptional regulator [Bacillota bacterium]
MTIKSEQFEQFGFKKTTVDEIAQGAGVSKRTLYEMFESKERIMSDLVMTEALLVRKSILSQLKTIDDPLEKLKTFTKMAMDYFRRNSFLGKVLSGDAGLYAPFLKDEIKAIEEGHILQVYVVGKGSFKPPHIPSV